MGDGSFASPFVTLDEALTASLQSGDVIRLRAGTYTLSAPMPQFVPITIEAYQNEIVIIEINAAQLWFDVDLTLRNLIICSPNTNRTSAQAGSAPNDIPLHSITVYGPKFTMQGCVVHDIAQFFVAEGCTLQDNFFYNIGWVSTIDGKHGHCLYTHNTGAYRIVCMNNTLGPTLDFGIHAYSAGTESVKAYTFVNNTTVAQALVGTEGSLRVDDIIMDGLHIGLVGGMHVGWGSDNLGSMEITNAHLFGNATFDVAAGWENLVIGPYLTNGNAVYYRACDTASRAVFQIDIINYALANTVDINPPGLEIGQSYTLRSIYNYFGDTVVFVYDGNPITVNLSTRTQALPTGLAEPAAPLNIRFGGYILEKS